MSSPADWLAVALVAELAHHAVLTAVCGNVCLISMDAGDGVRHEVEWQIGEGNHVSWSSRTRPCNAHPRLVGYVLGR